MPAGAAYRRHMPTLPKARARPWLPEPTPRPHQGRYERSPEYNTSRWQKTRKAHLQANPLCVMCSEEGRVTAATVVDHIKRVRDGGGFYDPSNHQGLCSRHHAAKSASERHQ